MVREAICGKCLSPEEREARLRELFGLASKPAAEEAVPQEDAAPDGDTPDQNTAKFPRRLIKLRRGLT